MVKFSRNVGVAFLSCRILATFALERVVVCWPLQFYYSVSTLRRRERRAPIRRCGKVLPPRDAPKLQLCKFCEPERGADRPACRVAGRWPARRLPTRQSAIQQTGGLRYALFYLGRPRCV